MGRHPDPNPKRLEARYVYVMRPAISVLAGVSMGDVDFWISSGDLRPCQMVRPAHGRGGRVVLYRLLDVLRLKDGED